MDYSNHICTLDRNLYQGSIHATSPPCLQHFHIDSILHFGFEAMQLPNKTYKYLDLEDNTQSVPLLRNSLDELIHWISDQLSQGKRVLVACSAGKSRSVTLCLAFLMKTRNLSFDEAYAFFLSRRPVINPNPGFISMLKNL